MSCSLGNIVDVLPRAELDLICKPECREELSALREKLAATCTAPEDVIPHNGFELPTYYFAEKFAYTFDLNCYKQKTTGRFCDEVWGEWREGKGAEDRCDDCFLGVLAIQLGSPIGVSAERAALFNQTLSSCGTDPASYPVQTAYTKPPPSAAVKVAALGASTRPQCSTSQRSYTVKQGDTCHGIALSQNVSTFDLVQTNALDINCAIMLKEGRKLCLNEPCETYVIRCDEIADKFSITVDQFCALNPMLDSYRTNIERWAGYISCIGPKSLIQESEQTLRALQAVQNSEASHRKPPPPRATTALKPLAPGSSERCSEFANGRAATDPDLGAVAEAIPAMVSEESMRMNNYCWVVAEPNGISVAELIRLNPSLDTKDKPRGTDCLLEGKYSYCVLEPGMPAPDRGEDWDKRRAQRWG